MQIDHNMEAGGMGFKDYLLVFLDRKWVVLLVFLLITTAAVYYAETAPPVYLSMSVLMSESNVMTASVFPMMDPFFYRGPLEYLTNLERLMSTGEFSTSVMEKLSNNQNIDIALEEIQSGTQLNNPSNTEIIEVIAKCNDPLKAAALANSVAEALIEKTSEIKNADTKRALSFLSGQLDIVDQNLRNAEKKLNKFKQEEDILSGRSSAVDFSSFGGRESYRRASLVDKLSDLQGQLSYTETRREMTQAQLESINNLAAEKKKQLAVAEEVDYLLGNITPQIEQLQNKIAAWEVDLSVLQENYTEKHPQVVELKQRIEDAQGRLQDEIINLSEQKNVNMSSNPISELEGLINQALQLTVQLRGYEHQEKLATEKLNAFMENNPDLLDKEVELVRLEREARIREKTYMLLTDRYEEMLLLQQVNSQEFRLVDSAIPPRFPVSPNKVRLITLGILLGIVLGFAVAFLLEYMDDSVRRADDVEKYLGLPIVGLVPRIQTLGGSSLALPPPDDNIEVSLSSANPQKGKKLDREYRKSLRVLQSKLIKNFDIKSPVAESYRSLWSNIQFAKLDKSVRTILITSPGPKEGKSLTTANLALTIAQSDTRVLIIDADLRRPTVHRLFNCDRTPGLSELITDDLDRLEEYVRNTYVDNLYVLPGGAAPPNPVGILGSDKMRELIEKVKESFDVVLFDSPPVVAMSDASVLATGLDLTMLVLQAGQTKRQVATQAKELMERLNTNIFGVVLNGVDISKRYGYYYYYYHYSDYYSKGASD